MTRYLAATPYLLAPCQRLLAQYSYPLDTVKALLTRYGFDPVKIADGESFGPVRPDSQRWIITAVKQYTQEADGTPA